MMAPELIEVIALVQEEIGVQLEILDREGGIYAMRCVEVSRQPRRLNGAPRPAGMNQHVGVMIRELVRDELAVRHLAHRAVTG